MNDMIQMRLSLEGLRRFIEEARANVPEEKAREYERGVEDREAVRIKLIQDVKRNGGKIIAKSRDGKEGYIIKDSVNKIVKETKGSTINKFTPQQHWAVAADIIPLYKNSIEVLEHPDHKGKAEIEAIRRFVAPLYEGNYVIITGKVIKNIGEKVHSMELIGAEKLEGRLESMLADVSEKIPLPQQLISPHQ